MTTATIPLTLVTEGERHMRICNACRYCEGFCAVFPAMERRRTFSESDLAYLANLCHDCGECFHSCQYAPPHEFGVNVPQVFAAIRRETYRAHVWPRLMAPWFTFGLPTLLLTAVVIPGAFLYWLRGVAGSGVLFSAHSDAEGSFYRVLPHNAMVSIFALVGLYAVVAVAVGVARFWRQQSPGVKDSDSRPRMSDLTRAISDASTLRYLEGGGEGCAYATDAPSQARRRLHHLTFYGFLLCVASTTVAAFYDNVLDWEAPYPIVSVPVLLGCLGGFGLLVGPAGLLWLKLSRNRGVADPAQSEMDVSFIVMLFFTSLTGFLLLAQRETASMGIILGVHLGFVLGLFAAMPYGKFVHGLYRLAALVRYAQETREANAEPITLETTRDDE